MMKPSVHLTTRIPLYLAIGLLIFQIFSPAPAVMFCLIILLGVLGASYLWARNIAGGIALQRQRRYGWAQVGDVIEERFILHNEGWFPLLWAEVRDHSDLPGYSASRAIGLGAKNTTRWTTEGVCERRGIYTLGPVDIRTGDPFGLFEVVARHNYTESFVVYPPIASLPPLLEPWGMARGSARTNVRSLDTTTNASSTREYVPGDAVKRIHWPSTARRSMPDQEQLMVKEFDREPSGDLYLILDLDRAAHTGEGVESTEEYAVILAASLANEMLRNNHAVGLIAYGREPVVIRPQKGMQQLWELLRVLAGVHAISEHTLGQVLAVAEPVVGRGMSVALLTPSTKPEWIEGLGQLLRRGIHATALLLDAESVQAPGAARDGGAPDAGALPGAPPSLAAGSVRGVMGALADLGVASHILGKGFRFQQLTQKRQQRPEYRTLGTGRVVVVNEGDREAAEWVDIGQPHPGGEA